MNTPLKPLIVEHEGSRLTISEEGVMFTGPAIRFNSGNLSTAVAGSGDKVIQLGDMKIALGADGINVTGEKIILPFVDTEQGKVK